MGKHSMERKKFNKKIILFLLLAILILLGIYFLYNNKNVLLKNNNENKSYTVDNKTEQGKKLVLKSNSEDGRYIEFIFDDNVLAKLKIYEQLNEKDKYEEKKIQYSSYDTYKITKKDDKKLILEVEKTDLEDDEGLKYEDIYDKYVNKIVGAYEVIE